MIREQLFELLKKIPKGKAATYKSLAKALNTSPRAVGSMLKTNTEPVVVPCHRVVKSDGSIGGYKWGAKKKKEILSSEGVSIAKNKVASACLISTLKSS